MSTLVTVASFNTAHEAAMARTRLEANGIRAVVRGEQIQRLFTGMGTMAGSVEVQVMDEDEDAARAVLALDLSGYDDELTALEAEHADGPDAETPDTADVCPRCGSENITVAGNSTATMLFSILLLGLPLLFLKRNHECNICGAAWRA